MKEDGYKNLLRTFYLKYHDDKQLGKWSLNSMRTLKEGDKTTGEFKKTGIKSMM